MNKQRYDKIMEGAAEWGAFYRKHPDKFAEDYLHIRLRLFQRILLVMMFWSTTFVFIAARGLGKTYLSAIYCVTRCILYPGTKVCVASGKRGQAAEVLSKIIDDLKPQSPELCAEINDKDTRMNGAEAKIVFHNSSVIKVVTASDSARGNRCHVLLLDEYRLISKNTIDTILRKFLTLRRMPEYEELTEEERRKEYDKEKNLTLYLSSAYWKDHWSYTKCTDTFKAMLSGNRRQFVCGFPYQLSLNEGLLDPEMVEDEMSESDFSDVLWSMEMEAMFFGSDDGAFFDFESISRNRRLRYPWMPENRARLLAGNKNISIPKKEQGEIRILSADIALMSSKKNHNDATAIFINQMLKSKTSRYVNSIVYADSYEGLKTEEQALIIRKMFDEFDCDYLVLDTNGIGLGVFDALARDIVDPETGDVYPALSCINDKTMAERCTVSGAPKVIWSVKASAQFNSDAAFLLREGFRSGRIKLLSTEYDAEMALSELKGYSSLSPSERVRFELPYIQTTLLIDELTKLQHEEAGGKVKITEKAGMRKDRYSSLSYNYYVAVQIENKETKKQNNTIKSEDLFAIRAPSQYKSKTRKAVINSGKSKAPGWY